MRHLLFSCTIAFALVSCVGQKNFTIHTAPEGASVTINGKALPGTTPITTEIKQDRDLGIVVRRQGYETTSHTVVTKPHRLLGFIWTQDDPRARYIEEDEVTIPMTPIPSVSSYTPGRMPAYNNGRTIPPPTTQKPEVPPLRPLPPGM